MSQNLKSYLKPCYVSFDNMGNNWITWIRIFLINLRKTVKLLSITVWVNFTSKVQTLVNVFGNIKTFNFNIFLVLDETLNTLILFRKLRILWKNTLLAFEKLIKIFHNNYLSENSLFLARNSWCPYQLYHGLQSFVKAVIIHGSG